ncbi:hypothetical protein ACM26V_18920 [Salipaludibacillus sp. HK11]|uniref:hypothetical protein n=1 Tax=Salipaludibacillus sp. HK11 TaxID=3394320 RepID=UPI0039FC738C
MRRYAKTVPTMFLCVALLSACVNSDEDTTGNEDEDTDDTTEALYSDDTNEQDSEDEKGNNYMNENETNEGIDENETSNGETGEGEFELADEGEERDAATTKEDNYMKGGTFVGGEVTDGRSVGNIDHGIHDSYERLVLDIYEGSYQELEGPAEIPNHFEVTKEAYPSRIVYTLSGIRGLPEEIPDLSNMDFFSYMETIPLFDDATIQLAAYVQEFIEFEVFEMHDPAKIVTDVREAEGEDEYATVYSVRTTSISQDDNLEDIARQGFEFEERDAKQVRTLHSEEDTLLVEEGYYSTLEEAEDRKIELENDGIDFEVHIEERGTHDTPENIE